MNENFKSLINNLYGLTKKMQNSSVDLTGDYFAYEHGWISKDELDAVKNLSDYNQKLEILNKLLAKIKTEYPDDFKNFMKNLEKEINKFINDKSKDKFDRALLADAKDGLNGNKNYAIDWVYFTILDFAKKQKIL